MNYKVRICLYCHQQAPGHLQWDYFKNPSRFQHHISQGTPSCSAATIAKGSSSTFSIEGLSVSHIEDIVKQILTSSSNPPPTTLSVPRCNSSWFFDIACCNHMTPTSTLFSTKQPASYTSTIHTVDRSYISVSHIGLISTFTNSLPDTYYIPQLTLNLISVGQLYDFGLTVSFSYSGCCV